MKSIRTIIVDDDNDLLQLASTFLKSIEPCFDVTTVSSAKAALNLLKKQTFDAIISDYQMPRINGIEFLKKVRKSNPDIPFIIFTGKSREEIAIQALNQGATHYVTKIMDPKTQYTELAHIVKQSVEHAKSAQALIDSEERYRAVFDNATEGIVLARIEDKKFVSANNSFCEMLGYSHEELLELRVGDLHPADQLADVIKAFNAQTDGTDKLAEEIPVLCKNGHILYADVTAVVVRLNGIDYQLGIFRDISSRFEAESARQESDELYRMIAEGSSDVLFITDLDMKRKYISPSS
ncbi:MAG: response regulator, partial [Candidatus Thorarchaeota archaeon]